MKLSVVRHGETIRNIVGLVQGDTESMLTEYGKEQAKQIREKIAIQSIDHVFSSPLSRAYQTALIIVDGQLDVQIDDRLTERDYGDFEGITREEFDFIGYWNYNKDLQENHGESVQHLCMRVNDFLNSLKQQYPDQHILVVTHSGVARAIHYCITGIPEDGDMSIIDIPNCNIMEYTIE